MADYMPAGKFKTKCLMVMDRVKKYGETVIITKHGKPVAKLVPVSDAPAEYNLSPFGLMKGTIEINGDITSTIDEKWNAEDE
jgi:prevent-host-death family protein